jgi:Concanavalin A-like lectin/glucanases superfamily
VKPKGSGVSEPIIFKETPWFFGYSLYLGINEHGHMEGLIGEEGYEASVAEDPAKLETNVWSHIALTFDGSHMRLYVNGQLVDTSKADGPWGTTGPLSIGCSEEFEDNFDGKIDEVRIYNRALSAGEIDADAGAGLQTPSRNPVAAYSFDAGEGTTAEDAYGEHDGAIEGAEWFDNGRFGKALSFDGENDCVTVEDAPDLQLTEELSLEAWVKPKGSGVSEPIIFKETPWFFGYSLYLGIGESGHMEGLIGEEGYEASVAEDPAKLETGVWSHVALTFDGAHMRLYVNGQLVDTSKAEGPWGTSGPLSIGCGEKFEDNFKGLIDEVRVYNRALDAEEVARDRSEPIPVPPTAATDTAVAVTANEAILTGTVNPHESETLYQFEYGTTTAYGQAAPDVAEEQLVGDGEEEAEEAIAFLTPNTTYHYRLVATNRAGKTVGEDHTFTTEPSSVGAKQEEEEQQEEFAFTGKYTGALSSDFVGLNWAGFRDVARMAKLKSSGAGVLRIGINNLNSLVNSKGEFTSERKAYDDAFVAAAKNHMKVLFVLGSGHLPEGVTFESMREKAKVIVQRYKPSGSLWKETGVTNAYAPEYWQVWNEPNVGFNSLKTPASGNPEDPGIVDPVEYGDFLAQMAAGIKEGDPTAKVLVGGLLNINPNKGNASKFTPQAFLKRMGHQESYQGVGLHPYAFKANYGDGKQGPPREAKEVRNVTNRVRAVIRKTRRMLDVIQKSGEARKRLFIDELGWPVVDTGDINHPKVSLTVHGELLQSIFSMIKAKSTDWAIDGVYYYDSIDEAGGTRWDRHTGLQSARGKLRPAWCAFQVEAGVPSKERDNC